MKYVHSLHQIITEQYCAPGHSRPMDTQGKNKEPDDAFTLIGIAS